ncbi:hypothetical protein AC578_6013 [Pseudocercospora eumusae]|uniref:Uncharacterized protein n=1 Tax=Pseudocercospora eumusae TaxID=321146 RepID=A0A139HVM8_9PEZI|nr:hypothetical protein AC578_6013 [Pseudocercospora eumusae]
MDVCQTDSKMHRGCCSEQAACLQRQRSHFHFAPLHTHTSGSRPAAPGTPTRQYTFSLLSSSLTPSHASLQLLLFQVVLQAASGKPDHALAFDEQAVMALDLLPNVLMTCAVPFPSPPAADHDVGALVKVAIVFARLAVGGGAAVSHLSRKLGRCTESTDGQPGAQVERVK